MAIIIEKLEHAQQHFEAAANLLYEEFSRPTGRTLENRKEMLAENASGRPDYVTYVAYEGEVFLATSTFAKYDLEARQDLSPWLASVATMPAARRKGIGRQIVQTIIDHARAEGVKTLYLFTPDRMRLYHLMGWRPMQTFQHDDGRIHTLMSLDL